MRNRGESCGFLHLRKKVIRMPMIPPEVVEEARRVDLLTWLQQNDPGNLVKLSHNQFCTKEHDSLKISNGKWYWFSRGFGGYSALDYLMKVKNYDFVEAVEAITGKNGETVPVTYYEWETEGEKPEEKERTLLIPELAKNTVQVEAYLKKRGISEDVIRYCLAHSLIFETSVYPSAYFILELFRLFHFRVLLCLT